MNLALGAVLALVARSSITEHKAGMLQGPLMRTVAFAVFCFFPVGIFLVHHYPAWSWMYFLDPSTFHPLLSFSVVLAYPACCVIGYLLTERLLRRGRTRAAVGVALIGAAGSAVLTFGFPGRLFRVGSYAEWSLDVARPAWYHGPWMWDLFLVGIVCVVGFAMALRANAREAA